MVKNWFRLFLLCVIVLSIFETNSWAGGEIHVKSEIEVFQQLDFPTQQEIMSRLEPKLKAVAEAPGDTRKAALRLMTREERGAYGYIKSFDSWLERPRPDWKTLKSRAADKLWWSPQNRDLRERVEKRDKAQKRAEREERRAEKEAEREERRQERREQRRAEREQQRLAEETEPAKPISAEEPGGSKAPVAETGGKPVGVGTTGRVASIDEWMQKAGPKLDMIKDRKRWTIVCLALLADDPAVMPQQREAFMARCRKGP